MRPQKEGLDCDDDNLSNNKVKKSMRNKVQVEKQPATRPLHPCISRSMPQEVVEPAPALSEGALQGLPGCPCSTLHRALHQQRQRQNQHQHQWRYVTCLWQAEQVLISTDRPCSRA
eukprot:jgi/Ulvmu1/3071/UM015_0111.1